MVKLVTIRIPVNNELLIPGLRLIYYKAALQLLLYPIPSLPLI